jgi:hypothetical protein
MSQKKPKYVGSKQCGECHKGKEHGNQYVKWLASPHNVAYWRLATDYSKFLVSQREEYKDIEDPLEAERCLKCHSTGGDDPDAQFAPTFSKEQGVGCEACHGPGSEYMEQSVMEDRQKFLENGGVIPDEKVCRNCHTDDQFQYDESFKKIAHPKSE